MSTWDRPRSRSGLVIMLFKGALHVIEKIDRGALPSAFGRLPDQGKEPFRLAWHETSETPRGDEEGTPREP